MVLATHVQVVCNASCRTYLYVTDVSVLQRTTSRYATQVCTSLASICGASCMHTQAVVQGAAALRLQLYACAYLISPYLA